MSESDKNIDKTKVEIVANAAAKIAVSIGRWAIDFWNIPINCFFIISESRIDQTDTGKTRTTEQR